MTNRRFAATVLAALVVVELAAVVVRGFVLDAEYEPYRGTLLRGGQGPVWQMVFLPVAHLFFVSSLVWIYSRLWLRGGVVRRGLAIGVLGWAIGQAPLWLLWYAEQPWPDSLIGKQLAFEFASSLLIGLTVAAVAGHRRSPRSTAGI
jgi:hypothetical protein